MTLESQHLEAMAFCATVDVIRKAKGKRCPEDFPMGSIARMLAEVDVISDTLRMLGIETSVTTGCDAGSSKGLDDASDSPQLHLPTMNGNA
ncbi:hypothetical protein [Paraburkholderia steynii]|nr:hypothetical protein [Paraburkholderia steynii]